MDYFHPLICLDTAKSARKFAIPTRFVGLIPARGSSAKYPAGLHFFADIMSGKEVDMEGYFEDYEAALDCITAYDALREAYPDAKVILTV
jgi:hypothetical protein